MLPSPIFYIFAFLRSALFRRDSVVDLLLCKVRLRMCAYGAYLGSLLADNYVAAVKAFPDGIAFLAEYEAFLAVSKKLSDSVLPA